MRRPCLSVLIRAAGMPAASAVMPSAVRIASRGTAARLFSASSRARSVCARRPLGPHRRHVALVGVGAHHALHQSHRRDAVDQRVVQLGVERHTPVAHALDQVGLPQRSLACQAGAVQARAQFEQLADPPGLGQRAVPEVVLEVEVVILGPDPLAGRGDPARGALEEQRGYLVALRHRLIDLPRVVAWCPFWLLEELQPTDVHRHLPVLGVQEARGRRVDRNNHVCCLSCGPVLGRLGTQAGLFDPCAFACH